MPIPPCTEGHDMSEPYTERLRGASGVTIVRLVRQCISCRKTVEVPESYMVERVRTYPCAAP